MLPILPALVRIAATHIPGALFLGSLFSLNAQFPNGAGAPSFLIGVLFLSAPATPWSAAVHASTCHGLNASASDTRFVGCHCANALVPQYAMLYILYNPLSFELAVRLARRSGQTGRQVGYCRLFAPGEPRDGSARQVSQHEASCLLHGCATQ